LVANLQSQLALLTKPLLLKEFDAILNHLAKGNVFRSKTLRDRFQLTKEDGTSFYVLFQYRGQQQNLFQVTNQISLEGSYKNRYDVTLLVNGLPLVQIELKRASKSKKPSTKSIATRTILLEHGLFQYVQLFVISNGVNTKYLANKLQSVKQTFFWADANNKNHLS
jgi:type I restriction enzyme R subunit